MGSERLYIRLKASGIARSSFKVHIPISPPPHPSYLISLFFGQSYQNPSLCPYKCGSRAFFVFLWPRGYGAEGGDTAKRDIIRKGRMP
jgi:hypothetical protein